MKKYFKLKLKFIFFILFFSIIFSSNAYAYLDPGTGGLIIQVLIASLIGIGVFFRNIKMKLIELFNKIIKKRHNNKSK